MPQDLASGGNRNHVAVKLIQAIPPTTFTDSSQLRLRRHLLAPTGQLAALVRIASRVGQAMHSLEE